MEKSNDLRNFVRVRLIFPGEHLCDLVFVPADGIGKRSLCPIFCDNFTA